MIKIFVIIVLILTALFILMVIYQKLLMSVSSKQLENIEDPRYPYIKKTYLLTTKEHEMFSFLKQEYGSQFCIFPQIHIASLVYIKYGEKKKKTYLNKIDRKSVDFTFCDMQNLSPVLSIELDDITHTQESRIARDSFVNEVFKAIGIPLLHFKTEELNNKTGIKEVINKTLNEVMRV